jgi:hypothetical protein
MERIYALFILVLLTNGLQGQTVPETQQSLITKVTATWCINCGTWGWDFYEDLSEDNDTKALMMKAHYSGSLVNEVSEGIASNFNANSQPRFVLDNMDQNASSSNTSSLRTSMKAAVDANYEQAPVVNAGVSVEMSNGEFIVNVKTKFFQTASGEYYTNVYVVEDNVMANQSGQGSSPVSHPDIIRVAAHSSTFGEQVVNGNAVVGMEISHSYTIPVNPIWNTDNLEFVAVVWSKSGTKYSFENGSSTTLSMSSPVADIADEIGLTVQPTLAIDQTNVALSLTENRDLSISLFNLQGQEVKNIHTGNLSTGDHSFLIEKGNIASGMYIVSIQTKDGVATRKIVFE